MRASLSWSCWEDGSSFQDFVFVAYRSLWNDLKQISLDQSTFRMAYGQTIVCAFVALCVVCASMFINPVYFQGYLEIRLQKAESTLCALWLVLYYPSCGSRHCLRGHYMRSCEIRKNPFSRWTTCSGNKGRKSFMNPLKLFKKKINSFWNLLI